MNQKQAKMNINLFTTDVMSFTPIFKSTVCNTNYEGIFPTPEECYVTLVKRHHGKVIDFAFHKRAIIQYWRYKMASENMTGKVLESLDTWLNEELNVLEADLLNRIEDTRELTVDWVDAMITLKNMERLKQKAYELGPQKSAEELINA